MKKLLLTGLTAFFTLLLLFNYYSAGAQCTSSTSFGGATANNSGLPQTLTTCAFGGEYSPYSGVIAGNTYSFTGTGGLGNFITVRQTNGTGIVVASGLSPLTGVISPISGTLAVIVHEDAACTTDATCHTLVANCTSCTPPPPPANDECVNAIQLTVNTDLNCGTVTSGTTTSATGTADATCGGTEDDDVWFKFTATSTSHKIDLLNVTGSTTDMYHQVLSACGGMNLLCSDPNSSTVTGLTIGNEYILRVYTWTATTGQNTLFDVCIGTPPPPPANDNCAGAVALTVNADLACTVATAGTTQSATQSTETAPTCSATGVNDDVWYTFVAQSTAHQVRITGATNTTAAAVYSGSCGTLTHVACGSTVSGTGNVNLSGLSIGTTYRVRVYTTVSTVGTVANFTICVGTPPPPPANDDCAGAIGLTVNADLACAVSTAGTTQSATQSTETAPTCSATGVNDDVWYTFVAQSTAHQVRITGATNTTAAAIYSGACGTLTHIACGSTVSGTANVNLTGLSIGTTYRVRVYTTVSTVGTVADFIICIGTPPPPPANDNCAGATSLTVNANLACAVTTAGTTISATQSTETAPTCSATGVNDDVWYTFVAQNAAHQVRITNATNTTAAAVYSGACGSLTHIACASTVSGTGDVNLTGLSIGTTYTVRVYTTSSVVGTTADFTICVGIPPPPPSNDACAAAITINGCQSIAGYTISGTGDGLTTTCGTSVSSTLQGVWYRFVGDGNPVEVNTCDPATDFDTKIQVYSGSCALLTCVGGNDDSSPLDPACDLNGSNRKSKVNWVSAVGETYYIYVYPFTNPGGNFVLNLISGPPCSAPAPAASNIASRSATISWPATVGAVSYSYSFGSGVHTCGTGAVAQAGTSINLTNLIPNTNYTFCVRTNCACGSSTYSSISFMTAPLSNDACAGAIPLVCNSTVTGSTLGAQSDNAMGICSTGTGGIPGNGVWYSLAGDGSQITLDLCGSAYDTKIHVYSGSCGTLTCVASNDDSGVCGSNRSHVIFNTAPSTTYYILVSGFSTNTGAFSLNVGCVCGAPLSFPWSNNAIGAVTGEGIDNVCGGSIDISSTGYSPSSTSDALFLSSQLLCGNQSITVKVLSITNGGFAGIMFRDTVSAGSRFVAIKTQLNTFVHREMRTVLNGTRQTQQLPAPGHTWLRLTRSGNTFTGFTSTDGITWKQAFFVNVPLNTCLRVGLFAQGLNPFSTAQAQFSMVSGFSSIIPFLPPVNDMGQGLAVFPNPASDELNLKIGSEYLGKDISINVMDQMGRVVLQKNINELQTQQEQINVSNLPGGLYVISLITEGHAAQVQKFIVSGNRP